MTDEDARVTAARRFLDSNVTGDDAGLTAIVEGLLAYGEERLRVNVGLVAENSELRRRIHELEEGPQQQEVYG